ncbi:MAG: DNA repair protein RadC [Proteobacteria bacterium]|nr:DNA repair protein RadC [Pseudomonadota bacterium]
MSACPPPPTPDTTTATDHTAPAEPGSECFGVGEVFAARDFIPQTSSAEAVRQVAARMDSAVLSDVEILNLHLAASDRDDALGNAERLLERFGGLSGVLAADVAELLRHVGPQSAVNLKLVREIACRVSAASLAGRQLLTSSRTVADYFATQMRGLPREEFWTLFLDKRNQLIVVERLGQGTTDHAPVYPREVLRRALEVGASALIVAHNHPSGYPDPSRADLQMTKALGDAAKALGLALWDHMIVGSDKVLSLKSEGLM